MPDYSLPAHIANRKRERVTEQSVAGMGVGLPPHVSIAGNSFTLIDANGSQSEPEKTLQCAIVAVSKVMCKRYYGDKAYDPSSPEPPICWSSNGIGPSNQSISPQNPTCADCRHNERGSAISKISGAAIKACRDEKYMAIYVPKHPGMMFQLVLTPGSFKNWQAFEKPFEGQQVDISDVITEISFQPRTNGVLQFQALEYLPPDVVAVCDKAVAERKMIDLLTGANDVPYRGALEHRPQQQAEASPSPPFSAPAVISAPEPPTAFGERRKRRTKAEMEAARAGQPTGAPQAAGQPESERAPFQAPAGNSGSPFGVQAAPAPNPEMQGMLNSIFNK